MVHNAWGGVIGNRNDLAEAITVLEQIDNAQIDIFEARTGLNRKKIEGLMDAETFLTAKDAVANGFADTVFNLPDADVNAHSRPDITARKKLDALLAQSGVSRSERRQMLKEATGGKQDAAPTAMQNAGLDAAALTQLLTTLRS
jgi:ATP-dependent Clp protease, protease subunit